MTIYTEIVRGRKQRKQKKIKIKKNEHCLHSTTTKILQSEQVGKKTLKIFVKKQKTSNKVQRANVRLR